MSQIDRTVTRLRSSTIERTDPLLNAPRPGDSGPCNFRCNRVIVAIAVAAAAIAFTANAAVEPAAEAAAISVAGASLVGTPAVSSPVSAPQAASVGTVVQPTTSSVLAAPTTVAPQPPAVAPLMQTQRAVAVPAGDARRYAPAECDWLHPAMDREGLPRWMTAIAWRESRCTADAHNPDSSTGDDSYGLFQINAHTETLRAELAATCNIFDPAMLFDADTNIACAAALYDRYGYQPWDAGTYFDD